MTTIQAVTARFNVSTEALDDIEVPVLGAPQRQGDLAFFPRGPLTGDEPEGDEVGPTGVPLVGGEATGNTHVLHAEGTVRFRRVESRSTLLGVVTVAPGSAGWVIHTGEHGVNGLAPGVWEVRAKRELADRIRRVAD